MTSLFWLQRGGVSRDKALLTRIPVFLGYQQLRTRSGPCLAWNFRRSFSFIYWLRLLQNDCLQIRFYVCHSEKIITTAWKIILTNESSWCDALCISVDDNAFSNWIYSSRKEFAPKEASFSFIKRTTIQKSKIDNGGVVSLESIPIHPRLSIMNSQP